MRSVLPWRNWRRAAAAGGLAATTVGAVATVRAAAEQPNQPPPPPRRGRLQGRVALISGAGSGIGQAIAIEFAKEGAHVVVNDLAPTSKAPIDRAEETAAQVRIEGSEALVCHADVSDRDEVQRMIHHATVQFGRLDIVVSNAYYSKRQPILEQEWSEMQKTFEVTQYGAYHLCQLGAKAMVAANGKRGGRIIVITSVNAPYPYLIPGSTPYNMAKASLEAMTLNFASGREWSQDLFALASPSQQEPAATTADLFTHTQSQNTVSP